MATIRDILMRKGTYVASVSPETTVLEAARLMNEEKIGAVVVAEEGKMAGIFTERDILRRVVAVGRDPNTTTVAEVMTAQVACGRMNTSLEECRSVMTNRRIRHLPVIDDEQRLAGIVTIGDLMAWELSDHKDTIQFLHAYIMH
ncbi:CBS domain-containing protein [bacterium]|nr:CBS domain-containing protein [bacterium]